MKNRLTQGGRYLCAVLMLLVADVNLYADSQAEITRA